MEQSLRDRPLIFVTNGDPVFLITAKRLLVSEGFDAVVMPLMYDPYEEIVRTQPDLLVIGFAYQEVLAWQLLDRLDADPTAQSIALVGISSYPGNLLAFEARMRGRRAKSVLVKPYDLEPLLDLISSLIPARS